MGFSPLTSYTQITSESQPRTRDVDCFIIHHAATTSLSAILALFAPGGRTVSGNYALKDRTLVGTVDENRRAWTSASSWDDRAVTIEVANSRAGDPWPVSDESFDTLARLIADVASRHGFPIDNDHVLTHQELYSRFGESYATACPGDLQRRKPELLALARRYQQTGTPAGTIRDEDDMPLNATTDYEAFKTMLQRALRFDVRPDGAGADWKLGPTLWERLGQVETAAKQTVTPEQVKEIAAAITKQIGTPTVGIDYAAIAKAVNDDFARRLAS